MVAVAGLSHKTAGLDLRERLALDAKELEGLLPLLRRQFGPCVVLSTCNRTELYVSGTDAPAEARAMSAFLAEHRGISGLEYETAFYVLGGADAVRHLYRVAAGLESMVLGEAQILGQVRVALQAAERAGAADALLVRLFQSAVSTGRKLRSGVGAADSAASVSAAAVELASRTVTDLSGCSVLVVSTGEAGSLTARTLLGRGAGRIVIAGRTLARAEKLAAELGVGAVSLHSLPSALRGADVVISATGARGFQIDEPMVAGAMHDRVDRPLLLIDLAVPRDVDPAVRRVDNVALYDIDGLQPLAGAEGRMSARSQARLDSALGEEVAGFMSWWQTRWVVPTISALRGRAERIRLMELSKTFGRLPNLSAEERRRIEALTAAIVNKLLHDPIMCLKESDGAGEYVDAVRELFALPAGPE